MKDGPGDHDAYVSGPGGVEFKLGSQVASSLTTKSGCRISQTDPATQTSTSHP
ncbi:LppA family lipoprotein [Mycobacterium decipiens]|uniref:LppA family lipoprotein n=1 Tax=Mycobacterium decipiens TaxID=1430326 RepID=UPI003BF85B65